MSVYPATGAILNSMSSISSSFCRVHVIARAGENGLTWACRRPGAHGTHHYDARRTQGVHLRRHEQQHGAAAPRRLCVLADALELLPKLVVRDQHPGLACTQQAHTGDSRITRTRAGAAGAAARGRAHRRHLNRDSWCKKAALPPQCAEIRPTARTKFIFYDEPIRWARLHACLLPRNDARAHGRKSRHGLDGRELTRHGRAASA